MTQDEGPRVPRSRPARLGHGGRPRRSSTRPTSSCGSTARRSAAPTCTSSRATCPRPRPAPSSATRRSAPCRRSGASVSTVAVGDRVLLSCISACGRCRFCKEGRYGQCLGGGGWIFGHLDRRPAGRVRPRAVRRQLRLQGSRRAQRRAGALPGRHPPDLLRGRRAQRHGHAGRRRRDRRRRPDRPGGDPHRDAATRPGTIVAIDLDDSRLRERRAVRRRHDDQQRSRGRLGADHGAHRRPRRGRRVRGGRRAADVRAGGRAGPARRARREHRRARRAR